jgi:hypothetical protein
MAELRVEAGRTGWAWGVLGTPWSGSGLQPRKPEVTPLFECLFVSPRVAQQELPRPNKAAIQHKGRVAKSLRRPLTPPK